MSMRGRIVYAKQPGKTPKQVRAATTEGNAASVEHWHRKYVPFHFEPFAKSKYGYQRRSKKYEQRKQRKVGHVKPLVFTGNLERQAESFIDVRASSRRGTGILTRVPKYAYKYRTDSRQPNKADELTSVTEGEINKLAEVHADAMLKHFDLNDRSKTLNF